MPFASVWLAYGAYLILGTRKPASVSRLCILKCAYIRPEDSERKAAEKWGTSDRPRSCALRHIASWNALLKTRCL